MTLADLSHLFTWDGSAKTMFSRVKPSPTHRWPSRLYTQWISMICLKLPQHFKRATAVSNRGMRHGVHAEWLTNHPRHCDLAHDEDTPPKHVHWTGPKMPLESVGITKCLKFQSRRLKWCEMRQITKIMIPVSDVSMLLNNSNFGYLNGWFLLTRCLSNFGPTVIRPRCPSRTPIIWPRYL